MYHDNGMLQSDIADYFSNRSREDLESELFPKAPELYNAIAFARNIGMPRPYREAASEPVHEQMVFFESNLGRQYTGNPRYIYERMLERFPDWEYVWCKTNDPKAIPGKPIIVERGSDEYYHYLGISKYLVNNIKFPLWYHRDESFYLQTWHGTPYKKLHWDRTEIPLAKRSEPDFYVKSTSWNALLAACPWAASTFRSCFRYTGEILEYGYPANDIFYQEQRRNSIRSALRNRLGIGPDDPVFLYAPTWRDGGHVGNMMFKFDLLFDPAEFLENAPARSWLLIRAHHMSVASEVLKDLPNRVINVSGLDDAIELMVASDVLISDYSSIVTDWYCSRKPVMYYIPDYGAYKDKLRGTYYELEDCRCGKLYFDQRSLFADLGDVIGSDQSRYDDYYNMFCSLHDGTATDRTIDYLLSH